MAIRQAKISQNTSILRLYSMPTEDSITARLDELRAGDPVAAQALWERYSLQLLRLASQKLGASAKRVADEEDVCQSAFNSFCRRAMEGQFPKLSDRDDLWRLLVTMTSRKAINQLKREGRAKRGGGTVVGEGVLQAAGGAGLDGFSGGELSPEFAAMFAETFAGYMDALEDADLRLIVLWKLEGRTNKEIARQLGCAVSSVERKLVLIRKQLSHAEPSFDG